METLCLAELLAGMSLVADVGMGLEAGEAARAALVAVELAIAVGAPDPSDVYYTTLLQHIGCTAYAHEAAAMLGGDEIAVKRASMHTDFGYSRSNCEVAARTAARVGLGGGVVAGLTDIYEHWDGKGGARRLRGESIARIGVSSRAAAALYTMEQDLLV
jgi:hypothetical protein